MVRGLCKGVKFVKHILGLWIIVIAINFLFGQLVLAETIRWEDFEYWDSPSNHGWVNSNYQYPMWGPGVGYGNMQTVLDFVEGSRVLDVWMNPSVFNRLERFWIMRNVSYLKNGKISSITNHQYISFSFLGRLSIEKFDRFELQVSLITKEGHHVVLCYCPVGMDKEEPVWSQGKGDSQSNPAIIVVNIGRQYLDGTWHMVIRDMDEDLEPLREEYPDDGFGDEDSKIELIRILGNSYRMDNIWFYTPGDLGFISNHPPKLQRIGPQFVQLFTPFNYMIMAEDIDDDRLEFVATIGGWGINGMYTPNLISRVKENPDFPSKDAPFRYIPCSSDDPDAYPNLAVMSLVPQFLEDLIITVRVTDAQGLSDTEVFPLSVVNYPITNHPPILEQLEDDFYLLGSEEPYRKHFVCYDPDPYWRNPQELLEDLEDGYIIESTTDPTSIGQTIVYFAYIDGLPAYQYGPYQEDLIKHPVEPLIEFTPIFEGVHRITVMARDTRGLTAIAEYTLVIANPGGWFNHPPVLGEDIDSPQIVRSGQLFSIPIEFYDPDIEPTYYSCNIGVVSTLGEEGIREQGWNYNNGGIVGEDAKWGIYRGGAIYTFLTYFPGIYNIQITAYDARGGRSTASFILDVQPWWSM